MNINVRRQRSLRTRVTWCIVGAALISGGLGRAEDLEVITLPPLRIEGQPAKAHVQGMEWVEGVYYVTARRDDVHPRRALLLRTTRARTDWDVWDITPKDAQGVLTELDHPGGMQSDCRAGLEDAGQFPALDRDVAATGWR